MKEQIKITFDDGEQKVILSIKGKKLVIEFDPEWKTAEKETLAASMAGAYVEFLTN